jgi:hypothetical protein
VCRSSGNGGGGDGDGDGDSAKSNATMMIVVGKPVTHESLSL